MSATKSQQKLTVWILHIMHFNDQYTCTLSIMKISGVFSTSTVDDNERTHSVYAPATFYVYVV